MVKPVFLANFVEVKGTRLLTDTNEILVDGKLIKLTPKEKGVLLILNENKGRTVLRTQILETVWGDSLGNDSGLTQAISKLRQIFKDDPQRQHLIRTVPKMGYQLIADSGSQVRRKRKTQSISSFFDQYSVFQKKQIRIILILILFIVLLLVFDIKIRIETLPT